VLAKKTEFQLERIFANLQDANRKPN
jgi:hypothetical protein